MLTNQIRTGQHTNAWRRIINICIVPYTLYKGLSQTLSQLTVQIEGLKIRSLKLEHSCEDVRGKAPGGAEL